jgi:polyisoprenyl-teichoic acid--peptidoglycan teichoic acid transferase
MRWRSSNTVVWRVSSHRMTAAWRSSASTRSVTSSRFPIGVAQTASGIGGDPRLALAVEGLKGDQPGADQAGLLAQLRLDYPHSGIGRLDRLAAGGGACRLEHELSGRRAEASADDDHVRVEQVDERADRGAEQLTDTCQRRMRAGVAAAGPRDERMRIRPLSPQLACGAVGCESGGDSFEMAVPVTRSLARRSTGDDDHVTELGPAAIELLAEYEAAPDAGSKREHDQVARASPGAESPFRQRGGVAVVLDAHREAKVLARGSREVDVVKRQVRRPQTSARAAVKIHRHAVADRCDGPVQHFRHHVVERREHGLLRLPRGRDLRGGADVSVTIDDAGEDLRPAEVDTDHALRPHSAATIPPRMPDQEKPYRLYRGGRVKGKVPLERRLARPSRDGQTPGGGAKGARPARKRRFRWKLAIALAVPSLVVLVSLWGFLSYLSFSHGIDAANQRVPASVKRELAKQDGLLVSNSTTILVLGTDGGEAGRAGSRRSDSIMLIRTDPGRHRLAFLSIPRDLRVELPGYGTGKINAAFQLGGATLALRTVKGLTGLEVNHVGFVDFARFKDLVDAVGGIDVDVPKPILSNRFDCPYAPTRCRSWPGWRFRKGKQHMDGRRALIYSRIRENRLDPSETDFARGQRQQQVIQATAGKVTGFWSALKLPFRGSTIVKPLATDLSAWQVLQLGWVYFRTNSGNALHCRLGGDPETIGGESEIVGSEDNSATIAMFMGRSAPLPPPKGLPYAPGCRVGGSG